LLIGSLSTDADPGRKVSERGRRSLILVLITVGIALDLVISAVLYLDYHRTTEVASQNHQLTVAAYEACLAGNEFRVADALRWSQVLALVDGMPNDPATLRFVNGVKAANAVADQPNHCIAPAP
jgi:hypothetical protein